MEPGDAELGDAISLDELRERGRGARRAECEAALRRRSTPDDICLYIYTSGTTGPPKGCLLYARELPRDHRRMVEEQSVARGGRDRRTSSCRSRTRSRS